MLHIIFSNNKFKTVPDPHNPALVCLTNSCLQGRPWPMCSYMSCLGKKGPPERVRMKRWQRVSGVRARGEVLGFSKVDKAFFRPKEKRPSKARYKVYFLITHNLECSCHNSLPPERMVRKEGQGMSAAICRWNPRSLLREDDWATASLPAGASGVTPLAQPHLLLMAPVWTPLQGGVILSVHGHHTHVSVSILIVGVD